MPRRGGQLSHRLLADNPGKEFDWHIVHAGMPPDKKMDLLLERIKRRKTIQGIKEMNAERELGFAAKATGAPPVAALAATATDTPPAVHQHSATLHQHSTRTLPAIKWLPHSTSTPKHSSSDSVDFGGSSDS